MFNRRYNILKRVINERFHLGKEDECRNKVAVAWRDGPKIQKESIILQGDLKTADIFDKSTRSTCLYGCMREVGVDDSNA